MTKFNLPTSRIEALKLFGLTKISTKEEIKKRYKDLVLEWHPDKKDQSSDEERLLATENTKAINRAYAILNQVQHDDIDSLVKEYSRMGRPSSAQGSSGMGRPSSAQGSSRMGRPSSAQGSFTEQKSSTKKGLSEVEEKVLSAVRECNITGLEELLTDKGVNINFVSAEGYTPLHLAILKGNIKIFKILLTLADNFDKTYKVKKMLVAVNAQDKYGNTPLHYAAYFGIKEVTTILIEKGAVVSTPNYISKEVIDPKNRESKGSYSGGQDTALHFASLKGHLLIVTILVRQGASPNDKSFLGITPLHNASSGGHSEICKFLVEKGGYVDSQSQINKNTPLHMASIFGYTEVISTLLDSGASVHLLGHLKTTALHFAAFEGSIDNVMLLISAGSEIDPKDSMGKTPLLVAVERCHLEAIKILLEKDADVNAGDKGEWTPLHSAVLIGHQEIVEVLLQRDAKVNSKTLDESLTSLHLAAKKGHSNIVKILIEHVKNGNPAQLSDFLDAQDKYTATALCHASGNGNVCTITALIQAGANINSEPNKSTPLHLAAKHGKVDAVKILTEKGAIVDCRDSTGKRPIDYAVRSGNVTVVNILLKHGAVYNIKNKEGKVPLDLAKNDDIRNLLSLTHELFEYAKNGNHEIISKLGNLEMNEFEAVTNARNEQGYTLLKIAITNGHENIARELSEMMSPPMPELEEAKIEPVAGPSRRRG